MMNIIRYAPRNNPVWSPLDRLSTFRDILDSAFTLSTLPGAERSWVPALELREDSEKITVRLEAAGMKKEDFDLSLDGENLVISGERKAEEERREGENFRTERFYGRFERSVHLPTPIQGQAVEATYRDGILTVVLPKAEEAKPKKIEVRSQN
jgi:HSP20 family protein